MWRWTVDIEERYFLSPVLGLPVPVPVPASYRYDTNIVFMMYSSRKYSLQSDLNLPDIYFCISPTGLVQDELLDK